MSNWKGKDRMRRPLAMGLGMVLAASGAGTCCGAQAANAVDSGSRTARTVGTASISDAAQGQLVRVIDDPHSGERWLLLRNLAAPAGPGRLVLSSMPTPNRKGETAQHSGGNSVTGPASMLPAIRAGDRLVVEENSARAEVRLEAVALGPADSGAGLNVRLKIGGKVVRAVALGPGRAAFAPETGARP